MIFIKKIPELKNTVFIQHSISVPVGISEVFDFFIKGNVSKYYSNLSEGHKYFNLRKGDNVKVGSIIDCEESAGNQSIKHEYHVSEVIYSKRINYYSRPSYLKIKLPWKIIGSKSNTYVYYDFDGNDNGTTNIRLTIGIQFSNKFEQIVSTLFGGLIPWKKHCKEEMEGLKGVLLSVL